MNMDEVIGQEGVKRLLLRQLEEGRVPHAQLFCGPAGSGKLPMALAFATALLCQQRQGLTPCGHCNDCAMTAHFAHPDLHFIFPIFKKNSSTKAVSDTFITEWRTLLSETPWISRNTWNDRLGIENQQPEIYESQSTEIIQKLSLVAQKAGGYKVVIVWQADKMNLSCSNKLLKTLEEPIGRTAFILVSDQPEKLLPTILSRVQRIDFPLLPERLLQEELSVRNHIDPTAARDIAHISNGSYVQALRHIGVDEEGEMLLENFKTLMRLCYMRKVKDLRDWSDAAAGWGRERQKRFLDYALKLVRENFIYNFRQAPLNYETAAEAEFSVNFARFINERNVEDMLTLFTEARRDIAANVNARMVFFDTALRLIVLLLR